MCGHIRPNTGLWCLCFVCAASLGLLAVAALGIGDHVRGNGSNDYPADKAAQTQPAPQPTKSDSPYGCGLIPLGNNINLWLALIPKGNFLMGCHYKVLQPERVIHGPNGMTTVIPRKLQVDGEHPGDLQHEVTISKSYYMGVYLVSEAQYAQVMGMKRFRKDVWGGVARYADRDGHLIPGAAIPAMGTWKLADDFCKAVSRRSGNKVHLPTEAQWERACRAGTDTRAFFGDDYSVIDKYAQVRWVRVADAGGKPEYELFVPKAHEPMGRRKPNPWGLYDMYFCYAQSCSDWWVPDFYSNSPKIDPVSGPESAAPDHVHVARGDIKICFSQEMNGRTDCVLSAARSEGGGGNRDCPFYVIRVVADAPLSTIREFVGVFKFGEIKRGKCFDEVSDVPDLIAMGRAGATDPSGGIESGGGLRMTDDRTAQKSGPADKTDDAPNFDPAVKPGKTAQLAISNTPGTEVGEGPDPDENIFKLFNTANAGGLMKIKYSRINGEPLGVIVSAEPYNPAPGEDKPGVYVFQRTATMTLQNVVQHAVVLSKFLEETTLAVIDAKLAASLENFKPGDSVKVEFVGNVLKHISAFTPSAPTTAPAARPAFKDGPTDRLETPVFPRLLTETILQWVSAKAGNRAIQ